MKKIFLGILFFAQFASATFHISLGSLVEFQKEENQQSQATLNFQGGIGWLQNDTIFRLEYNQLERKSDGAVSSFSTHERRFILWDENLYALGNRYYYHWDIGLGIAEKEVQQSFAGNNETVTSDWKPLVGLNLGITRKLSSIWGIDLSGRLLAAENFEPNPNLGLLATVYFLF